MAPIGVAVVGASQRSSVILTYLRTRPTQGFVTGVWDPVAPRSRFLIDRFGTPEARVYDSLEQALDDDQVEAVFVGTADHAHVEPACAALRAGKHVYCEKPMAVTLEGCDRIVEAAQRAPGVFYVGMNLRHGPVHETLHDVVERGQVGRLLSIEANEYYSGGRTYFRRWNRLRAWGGGLWITKACHDFDLLCWMAGGQPVRVYATSSLSHYRPRPEAAGHCRVCSIKAECADVYDIERPPSPEWDPFLELLEQATGVPRDLCLFNSEKDTFDNGIVLVDFDNDVRATYAVNVVSARDTRQMRLMGTAGSAEGDVASAQVTVWKRHEGGQTVYDLRDRIEGGHGGADDPILDDFFRCCQMGEKPRSSWQEGRLSVLMGLAATASDDSGRPVVLNGDLRGGVVSFDPQ